MGFDPIISLSRDKTTKKEMQIGSLCWNFCSFLAEHGLNFKHNHNNLPVFCRIKKKYILHIISFMLRISAGNGLESMSQISFVVRFKLVIWWVFFSNDTNCDKIGWFIGRERWTSVLYHLVIHFIIFYFLYGIYFCTYKFILNDTNTTTSNSNNNTKSHSCAISVAFDAWLPAENEFILLSFENKTVFPSLDWKMIGLK